MQEMQEPQILESTDREARKERSILYRAYQKVIGFAERYIERQAESVEKPTRWYDGKIILGVLAVLSTVALCGAALYYHEDLVNEEYIHSLGILGVFIVAFVATATSVTLIPVPYWAFVITLPVVLAGQWGIMAPIGVGLISAAGATLGHIPIFMVGYGGRELFQRIMAKRGSRPGWFGNRAFAWAKRHLGWAVFICSAVPNPLHVPMTVAIGVTRYPLPKYVLVSFLGNAVKGCVLAFGGYFGLDFIKGLVG
jgi:membrane protein DedA with SNARE-associated domain